jgi:ketosteroid isomerase-like protein
MPSPEILVLAANHAFYETFVRADAGTMDALWARRAPVACIHPGWGALVGREQVMESWRAILDNGAPPIRCSDATAHVLGETAYVICRETIEDAELVATNVFVLEDGEWRLAHHQAGPVHRRPELRPRPRGGGMLN